MVDRDLTLYSLNTMTKQKKSNRYRECPGVGCGRMLKGCPCCPTMTCPDCRTKFCFFHSNAHPSKRYVRLCWVVWVEVALGWLLG